MSTGANTISSKPLAGQQVESPSVASDPVITGSSMKPSPSLIGGAKEVPQEIAKHAEKTGPGTAAGTLGGTGATPAGSDSSASQMVLTTSNAYGLEMGEAAITSASATKHILSSGGAGNCVIIGAYSPESKLGYMVHATDSTVKRMDKVAADISTYLRGSYKVVLATIYPDPVERKLDPKVLDAVKQSLAKSETFAECKTLINAFFTGADSSGLKLDPDTERDVTRFLERSTTKEEFRERLAEFSRPAYTPTMRAVLECFGDAEVMKSSKLALDCKTGQFTAEFATLPGFGLIFDYHLHMDSKVPPADGGGAPQKRARSLSNA